MSPGETPVRETSREVLSFRGEGHGGLSRHDELALRDQDICSFGAKPYAHVSVSGVLLNDVCDVVGWNAKSIDHRRCCVDPHLQFPALFGATAAPGKNCTQELLPSSEFDSAPQPYGVRLFHFGNFATGAGAA
jgi:hypothetical protein